MISINARYHKPIRDLLLLVASAMLIPSGSIAVWSMSQQIPKAMAQAIPPVVGPPVISAPRYPSSSAGVPGNSSELQPATEIRWERYYDPQSKQELTRPIVITTQVLPAVRPLLSNQPLATRSYELVGKLRSMKIDDPNREAVMNDLLAELGKEFDGMHSRQALEIDVVSKRLESLKKLHEQRVKSKDKIVERRAEQVLGTADNLKWEASDQSPVAIPYLDTRTATWFDPANSPIPVRGIEPRLQNEQPVVPIAPAMPLPAIPGETSAPYLNQTSPPSTAMTVKDDVVSRVVAPSDLNVFLNSLFEQGRRIVQAKSDLADARKLVEEYKRLHAEGNLPMAMLTKAQDSEQQVSQRMLLELSALDATRAALDQETKALQQQHELDPEPKVPTTSLTPESRRELTYQRLIWFRQKQLLEEAYEKKKQLDKMIAMTQQADETSPPSDATEEVQRF